MTEIHDTFVDRANDWIWHDRVKPKTWWNAHAQVMNTRPEWTESLSRKLCKPSLNSRQYELSTVIFFCQLIKIENLLCEFSDVSMTDMDC